MRFLRSCVHILLALTAMACWAQSRSAQVVDDKLQPPEGPSSVQKARGSKSRAAESRSEQETRRGKKSNTHHRGVSHPPAAVVEEPKAEAPPPPPPTLAQQPPTAPQVSYRNGMLTVTANNSTLGDILSQVRSKTGASIEFPPALSQERVAAVVGPAPAPQVLATLLNGTRFDYILLGMNGRPDLLQRAIITQRQSGTAAVAPTPAVQARPATGVPTPADEEPEAPPEETVEQPEEAPQPQPMQPQPMQQPPTTQAPPNQPYPYPGPPQPGNQQPGNQQPGTQQPKTPEQLLQELQRMQQQQQQQQQPPQQ